MHWCEAGLVLGVRRFAEADLIVDVLTRERGRRRGLVYSGAGRAKRASLEPGNTLRLEWRGRLEEQLGHFSVAEILAGRAAKLLDDGLALSALASATAILSCALPEGQPFEALYDAAEVLLDALSDPDIWPSVYVHFELGLLASMGFGLDVSRCALSGAREGLAYISPRTGRAATADAAGELAPRLLALPSFLTRPGLSPSGKDVLDGLRLTGYFLEHRLFADLNKPCPEDRGIMIGRLARAKGIPTELGPNLVGKGLA